MAAQPSLRDAAGARPAPFAGGEPEGLVLCAISPHDLGSERAWAVPDPAAGFPSPELVGAAAALLPRQDLPGVAGDLVYVSKDGRTRLRESDEEHRRKLGRATVEVRPGAVVLRAAGGWSDREQSGSRRGEVVAWSARSRSRMTLALSSLDYGPLFSAGTPAMVTLTLPGDWLPIAPTGKVYKRLVDELWRRIARAWGPEYARRVWKLEFQRRGAPHLHAFAVAPAGARTCCCEACALGYPARLGYGVALPFRVWLSHAWAAVCSHPERAERDKHRAAGTGVDYREALKARDPKRLAVYFSKHGGAAGGKEYQHEVPEAWRVDGAGPGRFWGHAGLEVVIAATPVPDGDFRLIKRTLRRLSERQAFYGDAGSRWPSKVQRRTRAVRVPRGANPRTGEVRFRTVTRPRSYLKAATGGGFLLVNDGPALASALSRLVEVTR